MKGYEIQMTIAKICIGCQSNKSSGDISYSDCKRHIRIYRNYKLHRIFREQYCPCTTCLVKATCSEPKLSVFRYAFPEDEYRSDKCKLLADQVSLFMKEVTQGANEYHGKRKV